jgi:hypothetical protein
MLGFRLVVDAPIPIPFMFKGLGSCSAEVELLNLPIERRNARELVAIPSSLLSDGLRPLGTASVDVRFDVSFGIAEGHKPPRVASLPVLDFDDVFDSTLGLPLGRLVSLSVRANSELVLWFSMTSPPAMMTGLILWRRKGSCVRVLDTLSIDELAALVLLSRPLNALPALVLLPRGA